MLTMLESLNYSFRKPKNIIWVTYRIKQLRNYKKKHGVLRGPQLGKQRWRARLGLLRVKMFDFYTLFRCLGEVLGNVIWLKLSYHFVMNTSLNSECVWRISLGELCRSGMRRHVTERYGARRFVPTWWSYFVRWKYWNT